ncbi:MAG TPA: translation initiation factor IF-2 [Candidatus Kapabacteria bacterium]|nr:translation initiation factor IF-2 [Candidatus Kapabacteria bacterium]
MAVESAEKTKKPTVRTLATELNISHDTLIEFLQTKGFTGIKTIMSKIDDDGLDVVMKHFGKEKDVAEKRQKKVAAFKEKRTKPKTEAEVEAPRAQPEAAEKASEKEIVEEIKPLDVPEQKKKEVEVTIEQPAADENEVLAAQEPVISDAVETPAKEVHEVAEDDHDHEARRKRRKKKTTTLLMSSGTENAAVMPGLKIKGKIDLEALKPQKKEQPKPVLQKKSEIKRDKFKPGDSRRNKIDFGETDTTKKRGRTDKPAVNDRDVKDAVRRTMTGLDEGRSLAGRARMRKQKRKERHETEERKLQEQTAEEATVIRPTEFVTANELANLMNVDVGEIITKCIALGLMVSINQRLDKDTIQLVADEFGFTVEFQEEYTTDTLEDEEDAPETLKTRPPVVTIMGHVDHGKTSLLDYIRKSNVVAGESGGITQHIGAYEVSLDNGRQITFLDTPGHEAFTAMRARGAQVTDIVILVVAADDNVMPQTWEAISHAQAASVPIVIALNKIDRPESNPDRIRQQLSDKNVLVEEWGGKYGTVEISARTGKNIDKLLERVLLEADILDLKANPDRVARGVVIEAEVDRGRGTQATVLVQKGTLKMGDPFIAGMYSGRVRAMFDERGNRVEIAPPSRPVQLLGFDGIPQAGDQFIVVDSDSLAKDISSRRLQLRREQNFKQIHSVISLDDISQQIKEGNIQNLRIILKGDVDGSVEALADSLLRLSTAEVKVDIIHRAVGAITENDVVLAAASNAIIVGFHVRPNIDARKLAAAEHVDIRLYNVIYDCINEIRTALEGMLAPEQKEEVIGSAEVRDLFKVPKVGTVAGCYVLDGKLIRNAKVRVVRDGIEVFNGALSSLKRFKDDVREVDTGYECGLSLENFNDLKVGDIIEDYKIVEVKRKLETTVPAR